MTTTSAGDGPLVRGAVRDDLERLVEIEGVCFARPWSRRMLEEELGHDLSNVLVAESPEALGGEGVGPVGFIVFWMVADEAQLLDVAVEPDLRRRGVATALVGAMLDHARARGAGVANLEVRRSNDAARLLYERLGFQVVGVRAGYYADNGEDAILMERDL